MKRAIVCLALLAACSNPTSPSANLKPVVDSISPSASNYVVIDALTGHVMTPATPTFVCVYGKNLAGATVHFGNQVVASDSPGCGALVFTAPVTSPGLIPVYVTTPAGVSDTVVFVRH